MPKLWNTTWQIAEEDDTAAPKNLEEKGLTIHHLTDDMKKVIEEKMVDFYKWYETIIPDAPKWIEHCKKATEAANQSPATQSQAKA